MPMSRFRLTGFVSFSLRVPMIYLLRHYIAKCKQWQVSEWRKTGDWDALDDGWMRHSPDFRGNDQREDGHLGGHVHPFQNGSIN